MKHTRPPVTEPDPAGGEHSGAGEPDAFARLEARLERASRAAERLISEAAAEAAAAATGRADARRKPPPQGWQSPGAAQPDPRDEQLELLGELLSSARELVPADLRGRLADAVNELLLAVRALIDWYLERLQQRHAEPPEVQDIPVL